MEQGSLDEEEALLRGAGTAARRCAVMGGLAVGAALAHIDSSAHAWGGFESGLTLVLSGSLTGGSIYAGLMYITTLPVVLLLPSRTATKSSPCR